MKQINTVKSTESNSAELLFYSFINALAYSKFADVILGDIQKSTQDKNAKPVRDFYQNFIKNEMEFSDKFGKKLYQNIVLIVDEFCQEKLKKFMRIKASEIPNNKTDKEMMAFFNQNVKNMHEILNGHEKNNIKSREGQEPFYSYLTIFIEELRKENPQKLQELIGFEINKMALKNSTNNINYVVGKEELTAPASTFLVRAKEASKLERYGLPDNSCAIS